MAAQVSSILAAARACLLPVSSVTLLLLVLLCACASALPQVPPQNANRMVDAARGVLNQLLADVYIFTDAAAGPAAGNSPGYGITLVAETTSGCLISAEAAATTVRQRLGCCSAEARCYACGSGLPELLL